MKKFILLLTCAATMSITDSCAMFKSDRKHIELPQNDLFSRPNDIIELETLYIYQDLKNSINVAYIHKNKLTGKYLLRHLYSSDGASNAIRNTVREFNSMTDAQMTLLQFLQNPEAAYYTETDDVKARSTIHENARSPLITPSQSQSMATPMQGLKTTVTPENLLSKRRTTIIVTD